MVYVFLAEGFEEIEALTPVDILRRAGADVKTVGITENENGIVTGSHGIKVQADVSGADARLLLESGELEMIVLPGGMPGAENLDASPIVSEFIEAALRKDAYISAICASPMILGKRGVLKDKDATCYPGYEKYLEGAHCYDAAVVVDGNIITSNGMGSSLDFALELTAALKGESERDRISDAVMA